MASKSKKILITGSLGYVGGRVSQYLAMHTDYELILATRRQNLQKPTWLNNGSVAVIDYFSQESLEDLLVGVTDIIHLAAPNEVECIKDPLKGLHDTALGTLHLLDAASKQKIKRIMYFSTAHVYGVPLTGNITEESLPRPAHPYSIAHKWAEDLILYYNDKNKIDGYVIRLSNGFGAPHDSTVDRWSLVVNDLCRQSVEKKSMTLKSSGLQERDFIPLEDVSRATHHFLEMKERDGDKKIYNLGGGQSWSILKMAKTIQERSRVILGYTPELIRPEPSQGEENNPLLFSIENLKQTGFKLQTDFQKEIDSTLEFCLANFGNIK